MHCMCCWFITTGNVILFYFYFLLLHALHPCWNTLAICETDKEPINPTGFPTPFAPMIMHCCICTGISYFMLIWPWCMLYYAWWEAIKLFWILKSWNTDCIFYRKQIPRRFILAKIHFDKTHRILKLPKGHTPWNGNVIIMNTMAEGSNNFPQCWQIYECLSLSIKSQQ